MKPISSYKIDYAAALNSKQLEAVTVSGGPILVIAGAGSGKTRTIVYRVAWLVEQGVDPMSILLLTFTRKAAGEMLSRAGQLLDNRVHRVSGGTFHSLGNIILRRYARLVGYDSGFSIMDQGDSYDALDLVRKSLGASFTRTKGFPKTRTIAEVISRSVGHDQAVADVLRARYPHFLSFAEDIEKIRIAYEAHKKSNNLMDYDDLLVNTVSLLEGNEEVRSEISDRWRHILVDEYQDTNHLQARIVRLAAYTHENVMAVGDDSQSIYSFRGADFANIMEFPNIFPGALIVKLEENYRSTEPILRVTNSIIARASVGYPKRLFTRRSEGSLPLWVRPETEREQSRFVVSCIRELHNHGVPFNEIAILFRAAFHSFDLEGELNRSAIPYVKYGGMKFLESAHIKDVLGHLKVLVNPRDRLSWIRILKILPGIGDKTALQLAARLAEEGIPQDPSEMAPANKKYGTAFADLIILMHNLIEGADSISGKVEEVNRYYFPFLQDNFDNYPKRMRDLEQLADMTASYRSLNRFLNDMALEPPDNDRAGADDNFDRLILSTIHSAKGLEWHTVIILWATEGRIPSSLSEDSPDDLEEERRLIYVATTRAKQNLVILAPCTSLDRRQGQVYTRTSRFFEEIPQEYFRTLG